MDLQVLAALERFRGAAGGPWREALLELAPRVDEEDALVDHLRDQRLQLLLHRVTPPLKAADHGQRRVASGDQRVCASPAAAAVIPITAETLPRPPAESPVRGRSSERTPRRISRACGRRLRPAGEGPAAACPTRCSPVIANVLLSKPGRTAGMYASWARTRWSRAKPRSLHIRRPSGSRNPAWVGGRCRASACARRAGVQRELSDPELRRAVRTTISAMRSNEMCSSCPSSPWSRVNRCSSRSDSRARRERDAATAPVARSLPGRAGE